VVVFGQLTRGHLNLIGEFHWSNRGPKLLPVLFTSLQGSTIEIVIAPRRRQRRPHLGVAETTRKGRVATIPERSCDVTPRLLHYEFHQRAGIEIDDSHRSIALLGNPIGYLTTRARLLSARGDRPTLG